MTRFLSSAIHLEVGAVPSTDTVIALLMRKPDYIKILMCLEEPKIVSEVISCAIGAGVKTSTATMKVKLHTLEKWGLIKMERIGKYVVVVAKKSVIEKIKKPSKEKKA
jgi:hydrogenase maturation factor